MSRYLAHFLPKGEVWKDKVLVLADAFDTAIDAVYVKLVELDLNMFSETLTNTNDALNMLNGMVDRPDKVWKNYSFNPGVFQYKQLMRKLIRENHITTRTKLVRILDIYGHEIVINEFPFEPFRLNIDRCNKPLYQTSIYKVFVVELPSIITANNLTQIKEIVERYKPAGTHPIYQVPTFIPAGGTT